MGLLHLVVKRAESATIVRKTAIGQVELLWLDPLSLRVEVLVFKALHRLSLDGRLHDTSAEVVLLSIVEVLGRRKLGPVSGHKFLLIKIWRQNICRYATSAIDSTGLIRLLVMDLGHILGAYLSICAIPEVTDVDLSLQLRVVLVLAIEA